LLAPLFIELVLPQPAVMTVSIKHANKANDNQKNEDFPDETCMAT